MVSLFQMRGARALVLLLACLAAGSSGEITTSSSAGLSSSSDGTLASNLFNSGESLKLGNTPPTPSRPPPPLAACGGLQASCKTCGGTYDAHACTCSCPLSQVETLILAHAGFAAVLVLLLS